MPNDEYVDLVSGEIIRQSSKGGGAKSQNITINDATSEVGKILVKEFGSDMEYKAEGKVDVRRFSNISALDVFWLMFFSSIADLKGGVFSKDICNKFLNHRYSVNSGHKKIVIDFQESLSGDKGKSIPKDTRTLIQKYITQRGKPSEE